MIPFLALGTVVSMQTADGPQVTVYNGGFAMVKEQRVLNLQEGVQTVAVEDVAAMIEANSVAIKSVTSPGSISVLEQNYQYDLISPMAILNKAVGREIAFNRVLPNGTRERLVGTLMSAPTSMISDDGGGQSMTWNGMVIRTQDGRVVLNPTGEIEVGSVPDGLISKPTLMWILDSARAGQNRVELSYLTRGMNWKADYVLSLDAAGRTGDLKGWVTLTNNSGTSYPGARLKLLAGDVQRVQPQYPQGMARGGAMEMKAADAMRQESFADYHLYTLPRATDIRNREIKQVSLLEAAGMGVSKRLVIDRLRGMPGYMPNEGDATETLKPAIIYVFKNEEANKLGMPLPAGTFKVYQADSGGAVQLVGEDQIDHTPRGETVQLRVGEAFDVRAERKRTEFRWIDVSGRRRGAVETYEIEVRNRKEVPETVYVLERFFGETKVTAASVEPKVLAAGAFEFRLDLKAEETVTLRFTVESRW